MSTLVISAANLATLENNMQTLANNIGTVSNNVNTVNGHINDVENQVNNVKSNVESLEEEIKKFMIEIKEGTIVSNARQTILMDQTEFNKKFSHRDEVRRRVNGLLQSVDINAIKKSTVENISEETIVNTPDYWLSPAMVALCSWYTNNKSLANKALMEAMARDDEKTSLLFCLVHLRANRIDTSMKWLNRYLNMQDPTKMESKIITVLDAITSGVFGATAKKMCLEKVNEWILELNSFNEIKQTEIKRWEEYFREKLVSISDNEFPYIDKYVQENITIHDIISSSKIHKNIYEEFKSTMNNTQYTNISTTNKIDNLLHMLVFNYDKEELELKRDIQKNRHIIEENGDITKALEKFNKTSIALEETNNFYSHITNIAMNNNIDANINTKKLAISLSKDFIIKGYTNISKYNSIDLLPDINIVINDWTGITKNGDNELELQKDLSKFLDDKFHDEIYSERLFNVKMLLAIIIGLLGIFLTFKQPIISALIFCIILIFNVVEFIKNYSKRENKIQQLNDLKKQHKVLLSNILAEIVDYYFIYKDSTKDREKFINYINSFNYEDYVKIDTSGNRNIIIDGGNNG